MNNRRRLGLFQGYGIELEYMIVDAQTLDVRPICDALLKEAAGEVVSEVALGPLAWSNELALHVVELKTNGPAKSLDGLGHTFHDDVRRINELLGRFGARLMPTAMHPWMDPFREMKLWPHEYSAIYEAYDRIFDCRGHGWANLQSVHINLPFTGDDEFARLHAAIRLVLPLLPALAASSPLRDGKPSGVRDTRLEVYRSNSKRVPQVAGAIVPEQAFSEREYHRVIFDPLYQAIAPLDPDGVLQEEFLNSRGAIARFGRGTIEIRLLDIQECPRADLAICAAVVALLQDLTKGRYSALEEQMAAPTEPLAELLLQTTRQAEQTVIEDPGYLRLLGIEAASMTAGDLWRTVNDRKRAEDAAFREQWGPTLERLHRRGTLSSRIARAAGERPTRERLRDIYGRLCDHLAADTLFDAAP